MYNIKLKCIEVLIQRRIHPINDIMKQIDWRVGR